MSYIVLTLAVLLSLLYIAIGILVTRYYVAHHAIDMTILPLLWAVWPVLLPIIALDKLIRR